MRRRQDEPATFPGRGRGRVDWTIVGAPLDSSGSSRGEELGGRALRDAGLAERLGADDLGDVHRHITDRRRADGNGILALDQIRAACEQIRDAVEGVYATGRIPLVLGGDCTMLIGAAAGARRHIGRVGLVELDGHVDCYDPSDSPTGEAAEMDVAILTGHGDPALGSLAGSSPTILPGDTVVVGHRPEDPDGVVEADLADPRIQLISSRAVARGDAREIGAAIADRLGAQCGHFWVHFDVDVLDPRAMPAYTYHQPGGLDWSQVEGLLAPLLSAPALAGLSVACFVPPADPGGINASRLTELLTRVAAPPVAERGTRGRS